MRDIKRALLLRFCVSLGIMCEQQELMVGPGEANGDIIIIFMHGIYFAVGCEKSGR